VRKRFTVKSLKDKLTHVKPSITGCGSSGNMSINEAYKIQGAVGKESYAPLLRAPGNNPRKYTQRRNTPSPKKNQTKLSIMTN